MNIYSKIYAIQSQVKGLIKREENKFQGYNFFNELQVIEMLKPLLEKHKVIILVSDDASQQFIHDSPERTGGQHYIKYLKKLEIINAEDENEKLNFNFWACGNNSDLSKAKGSSDTYSIKYILSKLFLIPVRDEVDPDYGKFNVEGNNQSRMGKKNTNDDRTPFF